MYISDNYEQKLTDFQKKYDLDFKNIDLLKQAFVHSSYTYENSLDIIESYERLEFFGDAVLKLVVSDFLYNSFDYQEGELSKMRSIIVSDDNIYNYALQLNLDELIILGKNENKQGGKNKISILACAFEALLGAIFIEYGDFGYKKIKEFIKNNFLDDILSFDKKMDTLNPKSILQEYTQSVNHKLPEYILIKEEGLEHDKIFYYDVKFENKIIGSGCAKTIKKAQSEAAFDAIKKLNLIKEENQDG